MNRIPAYILIATLAGSLLWALAMSPKQPNHDKNHTMTTTESNPSTPRYSASGHDITPLTQPAIDELAKDLSPEQAKIILKDHTEPAFCGNLLDNKLDGTYLCRLCQLPLFESDAKFTSGTGWPSFFQPADPGHVAEIDDDSLGMTRTEIQCARCGGHLGHVFPDGPPPTGRRFCLNSASLSFFEKGEPLPARAQPVQLETAYFAGGCFWGIEDRFEQLPGVADAYSGYMGGDDNAATYEQVCSGESGHAETVAVRFDPARINYNTLLKWFFKFHNATQLNRQGPDHGTQYRSAIFATTPEQTKQARAYIDQLARTKRYEGKKIVTQLIEKPTKFHEAEPYHQNYHARHGGSCALPNFDED